MKFIDEHLKSISAIIVSILFSFYINSQDNITIRLGSLSGYETSELVVFKIFDTYFDYMHTQLFLLCIIIISSFLLTIKETPYYKSGNYILSKIGTIKNNWIVILIISLLLSIPMFLIIALCYYNELNLNKILFLNIEYWEKPFIQITNHITGIVVFYFSMKLIQLLYLTNRTR